MSHLRRQDHVHVERRTAQGEEEEEREKENNPMHALLQIFQQQSPRHVEMPFEAANARRASPKGIRQH